MELVYRGKSKDVYDVGDGTLKLKFKDDMTRPNGAFDSQTNTDSLPLEATGKEGLRLTKYFFEKIHEAGIPTHFVSANIDDATITVKPAEVFGYGMEAVLRYRAIGSFFQRYGKYCQERDRLDAYVEIVLKDEARNDPLITDEALEMMGIMSREEYEVIVVLTRQIGTIIKENLAAKNLELYDIKFEFGRVGPDRHIALIDEISSSNMRVFRGRTYIEPLELVRIILDD
jgi:phosphoribosylaminoimidazole-succinocarboxamide synthase